MKVSAMAGGGSGASPGPVAAPRLPAADHGPSTDCGEDHARAYADMAAKLAEGGYGWGHAKQDLFEALEAELGPKREVFERYRSDDGALDAILDDGARRAREIADATMTRVRRAVGIR